MAAKKPEVASFAVQSKVKEYLSSKGMGSSGDIFDQLNTDIQAALDKAAARCKSNDRSTVRGGDL